MAKPGLDHRSSNVCVSAILTLQYCSLPEWSSIRKRIDTSQNTVHKLKLSLDYKEIKWKLFVV